MHHFEHTVVLPAVSFLYNKIYGNAQAERMPEWVKY